MFERNYSAIESFAEEYSIDEDGNVTVTKVSFDATWIILPDYVIFDEGAFALAQNLNRIDISGSNQNYRAWSGILYTYDMTDIVHVPRQIKSGALLNGLTAIDDNEFAARKNLISVTIPDSVQSIGEKAFYACTGLTSVTIPNGVTSIGDYAFDACSNLTSVTIGNGVTNIGRYAFRGCSKLETINYDGTIEEWRDIKKGVYWDRDCPFTEVVCHDGTVKA